MAPVKVEVEKPFLRFFSRTETALVVLDNQIASTENENYAPRTYVRIKCPRIVIITHSANGLIKTETIQLTKDEPRARRDILPPVRKLNVPHHQIKLSFTLLPADAETPRLSNDPKATLVRNMFTTRKRSPYDP